MLLTAREAEAERHEDGKSQSVEVGSLPQNGDPFLRLGLALELDRTLDLGKLIVDKRVVAVTVTMVFYQEVKCLFLAALAEQESRGVGHEVSRDEQIDRRADLKDVRKTPLPRGGEVTATKVDPGVDNRSKNPVRVPGVGDGRSAPRVRDLLHHHKRGHQERGESETNDESAGDEQAETVATGQTS